jgi:hypothetical protein
MDETSRTKSYNCVSLFVDMCESATVHVAEGRDRKTVEDFATSPEAHHAGRNRAWRSSRDMSPAYSKGASEFQPLYDIARDWLHVLEPIDAAADESRRREVATRPIPVKSRHVLLKNGEKPTGKERKKLGVLEMSRSNPKSIRAFRTRENSRAIYVAKTEEESATLSWKWRFQSACSWNGRDYKVAPGRRRRTEKIADRQRNCVRSVSRRSGAKARTRSFMTFWNFGIVVFLQTGKSEFDELNPNSGIALLTLPATRFGKEPNRI